MHLVNQTPLPAVLIRNAEEADFITALLLVSATFSIGEAGLSFCERQRPITVSSPDPFAGDAHFEKSGVSVTATGHVHAPHGEARSADAMLLVGEVTRRVRAFGVRVWQESLLGDKLTPTSPRPFRQVAMTWENAFGGSVPRPAQVIELDGEEMIVPPHEAAFPPNREGTGYYLDRKHALSRPLPQLEDPEHLIQLFSDRPEPTCFAPYRLSGGLRASFILEGGVPNPTLAGRMFSRAAPRTTFAEVLPGTRVELSGMRPDGELLAFTVPAPPASAEVDLEGRLSPVPFRVDALDLDADAAEVRIVYRARFRYGLVQHERRAVRLTPTGPLRDDPPAKAR